MWQILYANNFESGEYIFDKFHLSIAFIKLAEFYDLKGCACCWTSINYCDDGVWVWYPSIFYVRETNKHFLTSLLYKSQYYVSYLEISQQPRDQTELVWQPPDFHILYYSNCSARAHSSLNRKFFRNYKDLRNVP